MGEFSLGKYDDGMAKCVCADTQWVEDSSDRV